jgi:hypothetical protein
MNAGTAAAPYEPRIDALVSEPGAEPTDASPAEDTPSSMGGDAAGIEHDTTANVEKTIGVGAHFRSRKPTTLVGVLILLGVPSMLLLRSRGHASGRGRSYTTAGANPELVRLLRAGVNENPI